MNAVLLHRPGAEVEAMTPSNAAKALYNDILNLNIVHEEYRHFSGALDRVTKVYYVQDLLCELLENEGTRDLLVRQSCQADGCLPLAEELLEHDPAILARELVEGYRFDPQRGEGGLHPLYNLFFTRDAASCLYDKALINSMSFDVRQRESLIYRTIFHNLFGAATLCAQQADPKARTEGGDVQVVRHNLLSIGNGIRTNRKGIDYLVEQGRQQNDPFCVVVQELPHSPESFIHLDMVFTHLGAHTCMAYEPMLKRQGIFAPMHTYTITTNGNRTETREYPDILSALRAQGVDYEPVLCGGSDPWCQEREQWHSGSNFFAFGPDHIIGYRRNSRTIEALAQAGFEVLRAEEVSAGTVNPFDYKKAVVTFAASELPRGGGGARCMTCPINREEVSWD